MKVEVFLPSKRLARDEGSVFKTAPFMVQKCNAQNLSIQVPILGGLSGPSLAALQTPPAHGGNSRSADPVLTWKLITFCGLGGLGLVLQALFSKQAKVQVS